MANIEYEEFEIKHTLQILLIDAIFLYLLDMEMDLGLARQAFQAWYGRAFWLIFTLQKNRVDAETKRNQISPTFGTRNLRFAFRQDCGISDKQTLYGPIIIRSLIFGHQNKSEVFFELKLFR